MIIQNTIEQQGTPTLWLVIANTNHCKIYSYQKKPKNLSLVKELNHDRSKAKGIDITTDKPGHYKTPSGAGGSYSAHEEIKEIEFIAFSREIAKELDKGRKSNSFEKLVLIGQPHINGLIHQSLDGHLKNCVLTNINKDYSKLAERDILDALNEDLQ